MENLKLIIYIYSSPGSANNPSSNIISDDQMQGLQKDAHLNTTDAKKLNFISALGPIISQIDVSDETKDSAHDKVTD